MNLFWADCILYCHALYVGIVVCSVPLIIVGGLRHWRWVRNPVFRFTHLAMIGFEVLEVFIGIACPLTVWEKALRAQPGSGDESGFIANWVSRALFHSYPQWVFNTAYIAFGLLVLSLFYFVPVSIRPKQSQIS